MADKQVKVKVNPFSKTILFTATVFDEAPVFLPRARGDFVPLSQL